MLSQQFSQPLHRLLVGNRVALLAISSILLVPVLYPIAIAVP